MPAPNPPSDLLKGIIWADLQPTDGTRQSGYDLKAELFCEGWTGPFTIADPDGTQIAIPKEQTAKSGHTGRCILPLYGNDIILPAASYWLVTQAESDASYVVELAAQDVVNLADVVPAGFPTGGSFTPPRLFFTTSIVRAATTANITISTALNNGDTLDGLTLATGDRVLVKDQSAPATNGVYVVGVSPSRATDFNEWDEFPGVAISVTAGTANIGTIWRCMAAAGGTLDTTSITFQSFGGVADAAGGTWGSITGTLGDQTDLQAALDAKQTSDATLTAFAALTIAANSLTIGSGADAFSQTTFAASTFPARGSTGNLVAKTISDDALAFVAAANNAAMRTALGATTIGAAFLLKTNPSAITFPRANADNTLDLLSASDFRTAIGAGTGSGDVVGPASATDNAMVRFDSTTGKLVQNSTLTVTDSGSMTATSTTFEHIFDLSPAGVTNEREINTGLVINRHASAASAWRFADKDFNASTNNTEKAAVGYGNASLGAPYGGVAYLSSSDLSGVSPYNPTTLIPVRLIQYGQGPSGDGDYCPLELDQDSTINFYRGGWASKVRTGIITQDSGSPFLVSVTKEQAFASWKDATPTRAWSIGSGAIGAGVGDDFVLNTYNGSAWFERLRVANNGAITGGTFNGNTITTGTGTLTLGAGKTATVSNTLTFTGTDGSTLNVGTGGTLGTAAYITLGSNVGTFLATPSSANLAAAVTGETGTDALVFANTPTLVTPVLGVATATSVNGLTITANGTNTLNIAAGKAARFDNDFWTTSAFYAGGQVNITSSFLTTGTSGVTLAAPSTGSPIVYTLPTTAATLLATDGSGANLTSLTAANITGSNTLPDGVLSTNVPLINAANTFTGANIFSTKPLTLSGNQSRTAWTTTGTGLVQAAASYTDTSSSGTVASAAINALGIPTVLASSVTTFTDFSSTRIVGPPVASTNVTMTRKHSLTIVDSTSANVANGGAFVVTSAEGTGATSVGIGGGNVFVGANLYTGIVSDILGNGTYLAMGVNTAQFQQRSSSQIILEIKGAASQSVNFLNCTSNGGAAGDKFSVSKDGNVAAAGTLAVTGASTLTGNLTSNGAFITTPEAVAPALNAGAAVGVTTLSSAFALNGVNALTLANGTNGQIKTIAVTVVTAAGTGTLTPTSANGFSTVAFTAAGQSLTLQYFTVGGWIILSVRGATPA